MKLTTNFKAVSVDMTKWLKALEEALVEKLAHAAANWIMAATAEIPVWSGASHATFLHLARTIQFTLTITPVTTLGTGMAAGAAVSSGKLNIQPEKGLYTFTYATRLPHLIWNEYNNANRNPDPPNPPSQGKFPKPARLIRPGPYGFQAAAQSAYMEDVPLTLPIPQLIVKRLK